MQHAQVPGFVTGPSTRTRNMPKFQGLAEFQIPGLETGPSNRPYSIPNNRTCSIKIIGLAAFQITSLAAFEIAGLAAGPSTRPFNIPKY